MRRKIKRRDSLMDYIPNKTLFKAVMFARKMMRQGEGPGRANYKAAAYYAKAKRTERSYK
jgi:hypothetical protein